MDKKYDAFDILDDIKRKKQGRTSQTAAKSNSLDSFAKFDVTEKSNIKLNVETSSQAQGGDDTREFSNSRLSSAKPRPDFATIRQEVIKPGTISSKPLPAKTATEVKVNKEEFSREYTEKRHKELYAKLQTLEQPNKKPSRETIEHQYKNPLKETHEPQYKKPLRENLEQPEKRQAREITEKPVREENPKRVSSSISSAFGDNAYKPYEATTKKERSALKGFGPVNQSVAEKAPKQTFSTKGNVKRNFSTESFKDNIDNKQSIEYTPKEEYKNVGESIRDTSKQYINDYAEPREEKAKPTADSFKLNIVNSFFEDDVSAKTQMDIPIKPIDNSGAATGFTRSMAALPNTRNGNKRKNDEEDFHLQDDYTSQEEAEDVFSDLKRAVAGAKVRLFAMAVIFGALFYISYALNNPVALPSFMFPEKDPFNFVAVNLGLVVLGALICSNAVGTGLIALFTLKPDSDTPIAMALLASIAQGVALLVSPDNIYTAGVNMYFAVIGFGLLANSLGKLFMAIRIKNNFKVIANKQDKYAVGLFADKSIVKELTRGQNIQNPEVAYSCKADFLTGYLYYSYSEDYSENLNKVTSPLFLIFNTVIALASYFLFKDLYVTLTVFTALMCICSPITATIVGNLPLLRISKKLNKKKAAIAGYKSLEDFDEVTAVALDANELFVGGNIILHGIKPFEEDRIDEAILDAASVIVQANGLLTDIFLEMIGRKDNLLKEVDSLVYEDCMGLSAWVDSKRVLIGNRQLMENHGIDAPPLEYERKFTNSGREVVYIANSGELTAMFVISYFGTDDMAKNLNKLESKGIGLSIYTTDPNITAKKLEEIFGFPAEMITIMSSKIHGAFNQTACDREKAPAKIALPSDFVSNISAICSVLSGKTAVVFGTILQVLGLILGYAFIVFYTFTGEIGTINYLYLIGYQSVWGILTTIIANIRRV